MLGWLNKCWGGMGVSTIYERARLNCTYADWSLPDNHSFHIVISTFKGENPQTNAEAAMNSFLAHLEQDDQNKNPAFLLKNLLILDFTIEQRVFLSKIGKYHNSQFHYFESMSNQIVSSSVKDLISNYYEYIRTKAKFYQMQAFQLVNKQSRQKFFQSTNYQNMLSQVNICLQIQKLILTVNDSYLNGNKSSQIIQAIFSSLLKTHLFCFSIISLALKTFINRIPTLSRYDLEGLYKLVNFFSKVYTRNFLLFIQSNKNINNFKNLKYNQYIIPEQKILVIIDKKLIQIDQDSTDCPEPTDLDFQLSQSLVIQKIQNQPINPRESESHVRIRRKKLQLLRKSANQDEPVACFTEFKNFYNQDFIIQQQQNSEKIDDKMSSSKKSEVQKKRKAYTKLTFAKNVTAPSLIKQVSLEQSKKFNRQAWQSWNNVYCT